MLCVILFSLLATVPSLPPTSIGRATGGRFTTQPANARGVTAPGVAPRAAQTAGRVAIAVFGSGKKSSKQERIHKTTWNWEKTRERNWDQERRGYGIESQQWERGWEKYKMEKQSKMQQQQEKREKEDDELSRREFESWYQEAKQKMAAIEKAEEEAAERAEEAMARKISEEIPKTTTSLPPTLPPRVAVQLGSRVAIVQKNGRQTEGSVAGIMTNQETHPNGIKVQLSSGKVGRVQYVLALPGEADGDRLAGSQENWRSKGQGRKQGKTKRDQSPSFQDLLLQKKDGSGGKSAGEATPEQMLLNLQETSEVQLPPETDQSLPGRHKDLLVDIPFAITVLVCSGVTIGVLNFVCSASTADTTPALVT
eukprot:gnl/MRDRNA2_/MRDRNA2_108067_c0_seq1.p1 gnl/MRDRNA2_/MRDRNA2_108067_c0~~gnl/MRDRNA2_/MRDRNA2_108067_c0_seq1.p1  ORF type:complete len:367 (+),score=88.51 gnl/MRDRNA2_/MRDRNA2_108067_c0_seq1:44-1144(+)